MSLSYLIDPRTGIETQKCDPVGGVSDYLIAGNYAASIRNVGL
jgi:hypothetical protein